MCDSSVVFRKYINKCNVNYNKIIFGNNTQDYIQITTALIQLTPLIITKSWINCRLVFVMILHAVISNCFDLTIDWFQK